MMKPALFAFASLLLVAAPACNRLGGGGGSVKLDSDENKTLYALGLILGRNVQGFNLTPAELDVVKAGLTDAVEGKKAQIELEQYGPRVNQLRNKRMGAKSEEEKKKGEAFAVNAAHEAGAERSTSGLVFKSLSPGTGESPKATDTVKVNYRGTLINGDEFDSSYKRGQPAEFPLMGVIPCWTEGLQKMKVGEKAKLICPSSIAYGDQGRPGIPGGATLVFEVELVAISPKGPTPPPVSLPTQAPSGGKATQKPHK